MIPNAAIAAAAEAIRFRVPSLSLDNDQDPWWDDAQAALEAAAPWLRAQALEDAADELDGEFTEIRRAQDKSFTWLCGIADAEQHLRARAATERGQGND